MANRAARYSPLLLAIHYSPFAISRLGGADAGRAGIDLDRSRRLELLAIEAERHDLPLDHALDQERAVAFAPRKTLAPMADLGLGQRRQFLALDAQHLHQAVVVEEGRALGLVGAVHHAHRRIGAIGRQRDAFRGLPDRQCMGDPRRLGFEIDQARGIGISTAVPIFATTATLPLGWIARP